MSMKSAATLLAMSAALGGLPEFRLTAAERRSMKQSVKRPPPRSMTEEEKEYYAKHKKLAGFIPPNPQ